jgi:hypothetical protein
MYIAYKSGRSDKDPSEGWYKGEIWFFDNYVIPLAKKVCLPLSCLLSVISRSACLKLFRMFVHPNQLKECGVFGVSSDEYLDYANANRNEWESKGQSIVAAMIEKYGEAVQRKALGYE